MTRFEVLQLKELPPLSPTGSKLVEMASDEDVDLARLAAVIEQDPGLAARIIGLANSAYFSPPQPISRVKEAIVGVLGLTLVKSLAISIAMNGVFDDSRCTGFDQERYWTSALGTAMLTKLLAPSLPSEHRVSTDAAYLAGLLHNLGVLALVHLFPDEMCEAFSVVSRQALNTELAAVCRSVLGADHHEAGGWIAQRWHLPPPVPQVMVHYADPEYTGMHAGLAALVGWSAARVKLYAKGGEPEEGDVASLESLGIPAVQLERVAAEYYNRWADIKALAEVLSRG